MGLLLSAVVLSAGALSANDPADRSLAALVVAAAWVAVRWQLTVRDVPTFTATELVGSAAFTSVPFAVDGHAQTNVFLAMAPLGALAALCSNRRELLLFAGTWLFAYALGAMIGTGPGALVEHHRFDAAEQVLIMVASCGIFYVIADLVRAYAAHLDDQVRVAVDESTRTVPGANLNDDVETDHSTAPSPDLNVLSRREKEVLRLITEGKQSDEIGRELYIATRTVESDRSKILHKLDVGSMPEAVTFYVEREPE
jgi:DNA-binding CsgD family transcriptional regulator